MTDWSFLPLPGNEEAKAMGYSLYANSGDHKHATYTKDGIALDVWYSSEGMSARLSFVHRILVISTFGDGLGFSFPHPDFVEFERQIVEAKRAIEEHDSRGEPF